MNNKVKIIELSEAQLIAGNIRKLMELHKVTDTQLAKAIGVSIMTIRRVTSGETEDPRISTIGLIANYFKINIGSLLEHNDMPINFTQNNKPKFIPILDWELIEKTYGREEIDFSKWDKWYPLLNNDSLNLNENAFAINSKPSMQPRFPNGTLFIINPKEPIIDNDMILIQIKNSRALSLRELIIDPPRWILQPTICGSEAMFFNQEDHDIIGVVILTVLHSRN